MHHTSIYPQKSSQAPCPLNNPWNLIGIWHNALKQLRPYANKRNKPAMQAKHTGNWKLKLMKLMKWELMQPWTEYWGLKELSSSAITLHPLSLSNSSLFSAPNSLIAISLYSTVLLALAFFCLALPIQPLQCPSISLACLCTYGPFIGECAVTLGDHLNAYIVSNTMRIFHA